MKKISYIIAVFFALCSAVLYFKLNAVCKEMSELKTENSAVIGNNKVLLEQLEKEHNDKMELSRKFGELEEASAKDKAVFDWYADISNTAVIKRLQSDQD